MSTVVERRVRTPRHANLRTLQRRLRHVRSLAIRSLKSPEAILWDNLAVKVKFTIHELENRDQVLYTSSSLGETYNPTWRSLSFQYDNLGERFTLNKFLIRVWLTVLSRNEDIMCFEKIINLNSYVYMGSNIGRCDNINHTTNSVLIAMFEGYYCDMQGGGYPSPHRPSYNELSRYLPRNSLIEVPKHTVNDSYHLKDLKRMMEQQNRLTTLRKKLKIQKEQIISTRQNMAESISKREGYSRLKVRVELLKRQLMEQKKVSESESRRLNNLRDNLNERESVLNGHQKKLTRSLTQYQDDNMIFLQRRDQLAKTQRKLYLRQRTLIAELSQTFCIKQLNETFTICDVILPQNDPMETGGANAEQVGVALGYVAQLVSLVSQFLLIPLQYPIHAVGPRAIIIDNIHIGLDIKEFPLYYKGTDKSLYLFGLYLLWRDILQIRQHCALSTHKSTVKHTLYNLKNLLDKLMTDRYSIFPLRDSANSTSSSIQITAPLNNLTSPSPLPYSPYFNESFSQSPDRSTTPLSLESPAVTEQGEWSSPDHTHHSPRLRSSPLVDHTKLPLGTPPTTAAMRNKELISPELENPFQLSESPSRKTIYMLDVPQRKISDADNFLMKFSVEESLPASLPQSSPLATPPVSNLLHGYNLEQFNGDGERRGGGEGRGLMNNSSLANKGVLYSSEISQIEELTEETAENC